MARICDIERCNEQGTHELNQTNDYRLCDKHLHEWKNGGMRLRANAKKRTLRLVEVMISDG